jgi:hypothetical protein
MAIENEESGSAQQGRQIHITVDSLTITIPSMSVTFSLTERETDQKAPHPNPAQEPEPAATVALGKSEELGLYVDDPQLGSEDRETREVARAKLVLRAIDEINYLADPLIEALCHPRSQEQLKKLAEQHPGCVIFTRRQDLVLLSQEKYSRMLTGRKSRMRLAYSLAAERASIITKKAIDWNSMMKAWGKYKNSLSGPGLHS